MLKNLLIRNYALIQQLEMQPSPTLNMVTGETGAGKSIMIGALGLLLGKRADTKVLFRDDEKCVVEGIFDIKEYSIKDFFEFNDLDYHQECIIRREISPSGKSRAFVNDLPVTINILSELGSYLMDVHSQHDTLLLGNNNFQIQVIDAFSNGDSMLELYKKHFAAYRNAQKALNKLLSEANELKKEVDYQNFLYDELEKANLKAGESKGMTAELSVLENAEEIKIKLNHLIELIHQSEFSVNQNLSQANSTVKQLASLSPKFISLGERIESCLIEINDIGLELEREESLVEHDPAKIESLKERVDLIYSLQQKHRVENEEELIAIKDDLAGKLEKVLNLDDEIKQLQSNLKQATSDLMEAGNKLSKNRTSNFPNFSRQLQTLLSELGMPDSRIEIQHKTVEPTANGLDDITILFSANKGITPQSLKSVASGGEFSRLMFCIKFIIADKTALPTIIFDEVDTGISGEIAIKMGQMMKKMARNHQVVTITHLPQIAAQGDRHYFVYKENLDHKAISKIRPLNNQERIDEIAKMIGGESPSKIAFENAKELLEVK